MKTETKRILEKAQAGDAEAQYLTGMYYEDKGNTDEAFLWYDRSAMQGFVFGINAVAIYYLKGMAVKRDTVGQSLFWRVLQRNSPQRKPIWAIYTWKGRDVRRI